MGQDEEWKILAEEAAQEKDPKKLMEIIASLTRALEKRDEQRNRNGSGIQQGAA
jgi:hypothetical protein